LLKVEKPLDALAKLAEARTIAKEVLPYGMMLASVYVKLGIIQMELGLFREARLVACFSLIYSVRYQKLTL
jgi:hypothetical protein